MEPALTLTTAGVSLREDGNIFIAKRIPGKYLGACWEFPGGKVKPGELPEDALAREFWEEFGVRVDVGKEFCSGGFWGNGKVYELTAFWVDMKGTPVCREHSKTKWVPLSEVFTYPFPPSDSIILGALRGYAENYAK